MKPSTPSNPSNLKKAFFQLDEKISFVSEKGKAFRWVFLLGVLSIAVLGLIIFLESVVEPRIGVNLTAETTGTSEASPPVLEQIGFPEQIEKMSESLQTQGSPFGGGEEKKAAALPPAVPSAEISDMKERLKMLEEHLAAFVAQEEMHRELATAFILLRQDIRQGISFEASLHRMENLLPSGGSLREIFHQLEPFSQQGVWSLEKILNQFSASYFRLEPEKTGFWGSVSEFIKKLWVVRKTDQPASFLEQRLQKARTSLHQGDLGGALSILQSIPLSSNPAAQEWFLQVQRFAKAETALRVFEQSLFQSSPLGSH